MIRILKSLRGLRFKLYSGENDKVKPMNNKEIESLFYDTDSIVGIYEVEKSQFSEEYLQDIFKKGLIYINKNRIYNYRSLKNMVKFFNDYWQLIENISNCSSNIDGYIIIKFLKTYLGEDDDNFHPIYWKDNQQIRLLNEFIYGYVPIDSNGNIKEIILNNNYRYSRYIDNKNLLYESLVEFKLQQKGIYNYYNQLTLEEQFSIIKNAYIDTLNNYHKKQADYALRSLKENGVAFFYGNENRELLKKYIIYGDLQKLLSYGLNNDTDTALDVLIDLFIEKYSDNEFVKKISK